MRMIPPFISKPLKSKAEQRVFNAVKELSSSEGYSCLHSVELPEHQYKICGELDFIILSPRGLFVLEVKGGRVSCKDGIWSFIDRWDRENKKSEGPFAQAESGMFSLRERMLNYFTNQELSQLVFGYGVVFPDIDFDVQGLEFPHELILDAQIWREKGISGYLKNLETYWHNKVTSAPANAPLDLVKSVLNKIRPDFELGQSINVLADKIEERLVRFTEEQCNKLDMIEDCSRILIQGGAGTGKTFLACEIASRHASKGEKVLLLCFSPVLANFLKFRIQNSSIEVVSVNDLMLKVVRRYGQLPQEFSNYLNATDSWYIKQLLPAFETASRNIPVQDKFDVLIIDEGQDILNLDYLGALGNLLVGGLERGKWRIFYDQFNQGAIFGAMDIDFVNILKSFAVVAPQLQINCRNTDQIVNQTKLYTGADLGNRSTGPGPKVEMVYYDDKVEAAHKIQDYLEKLWEKHVPPSDISILSPVSFQDSSIRLLENRWLKRITKLEDPLTWKFPFKGLTFSTIADFKGLENRFIILTDIEDLDSTPTSLANVYVGMSRARVNLWMGINKKIKTRMQEVGIQQLTRLGGLTTNVK